MQTIDYALVLALHKARLDHAEEIRRDRRRREQRAQRKSRSSLPSRRHASGR